MLKTDNCNANGHDNFKTVWLTHFSRVAYLIETSYLICSAIRITGFYMKYNNRLKWISLFKIKVSITQKVDNKK